MTDIKKIIERRKFKRFHVETPAYIDAIPKVGRVVDISKGGVAFRYHADYGFRPGRRLRGAVLLGVNFYLDQIPLVVVSDLPVNVAAPAIVIERLCAARIEPLSPSQSWRLTYFIWQNAANRAAGLRFSWTNIRDALSCFSAFGH